MENNKITVLHSYPVWLGQTLTWMHSQVAELQRSGVDAHVVCERTENLDQFGVANIHCLASESNTRQVLDKGLRKLRLRRHLGYLVHVGRKAGAQIVHSHFGNIGWENLGAVHKMGAKHVVTFYGLDVNMLPKLEVWRKRYIKLFAEADLFLCEGSHMASCLISLGCPAHKIQVHHIGIRVRDIHFQPRLWSAGTSIKFLIASTFREKKGVPLALEMLGCLQDEYPIEITIVGEATYEERSINERKKIFKVIDHYGLRGRTRFLGFQPHKVLFEQAYKHHVFLSPSVTASDGDTEGGAPVSIIEMMASGMPVISTTHCDIPEIMRPEAARFLSPERDVKALLDRTRAILIDWPSLSLPLVNLRRYVEEEYDHITQGRRLKDIYCKVNGMS